MSLFWDAFEGFARGYLQGAEVARYYAAGRDEQESGRIERLCRQVGWAVNEYIDNSVVLHFKDQLGTTRKVFFDGGDEALVTVTVYSHVRMAARQIPHQIIGYLLRQNCGLAIGAWQVFVDNDETASFSLVYRALGRGLTGESFRYICESMIAETVAVDKKMQTAGLLRLS